MSKMYVGDVGTILRVDTKVDLTAFTTHNLTVKKPDGTVAEWVGNISTTGNTLIDYVTQAGDLDQEGIYMAHAKGVTAGWSGLGDSFEFYVNALWS